MLSNYSLSLTPVSGYSSMPATWNFENIDLWLTLKVGQDQAHSSPSSRVTYGYFLLIGTCCDSLNIFVPGWICTFLVIIMRGCVCLFVLGSDAFGNKAIRENLYWLQCGNVNLNNTH